MRITFARNMRLKPDCGNLPWLAAGLTIFGAAGRLLLPANPIWLGYVFFGVVAVAAIYIAYLGWSCHVERQLPAPQIRKLIAHLAKKGGFSGTVAEFNKEAQKVLYEKKLATYIRESPDYYSLLIANDYIKIIGASNIGRPDSGLYIVLSEKAQKVHSLERNSAT